MSKISVKPEKISIRNLLDKVETGKIQIPIFQREFVWKPKQMLELFDSILKGFPIGSLLLWKPTEKYDTKDNVGPYPINKDGIGSDILYVLDGYQRITTLFSVLSNPKNFNLTENNPDLRAYLICYLLKEIEEKENAFRFVKGKKDIYHAPLYKLFDHFEYLDYSDLIREQIEDKTENRRLIEKCRLINKVFYDYEIPYIEINGGDIESAVEIFSRVNSTGKPIDPDYMLSALSYNSDTKFLLSDKITDFLAELNNYNFDTLNRDIILNCIINSEGRFYYDVKLEDLKKRKSELQELTERAFPHIKEAIKFLYSHLYIFNIRLLPYPSQLIFFSEYFRLNPYNKEDKKLQKLKEWFWITSYTNYFTASLTFQRDAYKVFKEFAKADYNENLNGVLELDINEQIEGNGLETLPFPKKVDFTGVRPKVLQLFMIYKICEGQEIGEQESLKEMFIFNKKDRTPANMILRLSSEFEQDKTKKDIGEFIKQSDNKILGKYFINGKVQQLFIEGKEDEFIAEREKFIRTEERRFVEDLGIVYTE